MCFINSPSINNGLVGETRPIVRNFIVRAVIVFFVPLQFGPPEQIWDIGKRRTKKRDGCGGDRTEEH